MCGKRYGHGLRSTVILLLLVLVLPQGLYSASALDEIVQISSELKTSINNLKTELSYFQNDLDTSKSSISLGMSRLDILETTSKLQEQALTGYKSELTLVKEDFKTLRMDTSNLMSGYKSMEKSLKLYKVIGNVSIGIAVGSVVVTTIVILANR